ncbi:MAG: serine/threonine-protein kinase [Polyangiaceae bacterium]
MSAAPIVTPEVGPGAIVGGHRLERALGEGAFGRVFIARRTQDGQLVALKVLRDEALHASRETLMRFRREAELARRLDHPNVVRVFGSGVDGALHWIACELLSGHTLDANIARGPTPPERVIAIALEALAGFEAAHDAGIIHRDIKPANLFFHTNELGIARIKLLDFGVAKAIDTAPAATLHGEAITSGGMTLGTPAYIAPEQLVGLPVTPACDLFSLGIVLAELVLGRHLYGADVEAHEILRGRLGGQPPPLPEPLKATPLGAVLVKATAPDPADRFASATAMRQELEAARAESLRRVREVEPPKESSRRAVAETETYEPLPAETAELEPWPSKIERSKPAQTATVEIVRRRPSGRVRWLLVALAILVLGGALFFLVRFVRYAHL